MQAIDALFVARDGKGTETSLWKSSERFWQGILKYNTAREYVDDIGFLLRNRNSRFTQIELFLPMANLCMYNFSKTFKVCITLVEEGRQYLNIVSLSVGML